jgi:hypothetical protein
MKILIVGGGPSDTWVIRGQQLGAALGARVTASPTAADWTWADRVILVKRAGRIWGGTAHGTGVPILWDPIDFWQQPGENGYSAAEARAHLAQAIAAVGPVLTIGATAAMAAACGGAYLPHHSWAGLAPTPARETVSLVAYQGSPRYLGRWAPALAAACQARGWRFVLNPPDVRAADLLVAFRDAPWDGWMCREWKSGVKLVNAVAAGRPILTQPSAAAREFQPAGTILETQAELEAALDHWTDVGRRQAVVEQSLVRAPAFTVDAIAAQYARILETT